LREIQAGIDAPVIIPYRRYLRRFAAALWFHLHVNGDSAAGNLRPGLNLDPLTPCVFERYLAPRFVLYTYILYIICGFSIDSPTLVPCIAYTFADWSFKLKSMKIQVCWNKKLTIVLNNSNNYLFLQLCFLNVTINLIYYFLFRAD